MPKPAAQHDRAAPGFLRLLDLFDDGIDEFWPQQIVGQIAHGQHGNVAALLARNQFILGHHAPPSLDAAMRPVYSFAVSLHHDLQFASHDGELNDYHHFTWLCCADGKRSGSPSYFLKCVKRQRISSSAPGPSCGCKSWVLTRCPVSLSTMASFTGCPVFRSTNLSGGPASPETAHLSPTCTSACRTRMVSRPFEVRTYSYRSGLVWYW